jgi:hypothetical protein
MAWSTITSTTTKHDCGGPVFGRKTPGCPRCDELLAGAEPVKWNGPTQKEKEEAYRVWLARLKSHDCKASNCAPICVAFDW